MRKLIILILLIVSVPCSVLAYRLLFPFEPIELHEIAEEPLDVLAVDIDSDSNDDVVIAHRSGRGLSIFLNNQDGTITFHDFIDIGYGATSVAAGNFNEDQFLDLVVSACNVGCTENGLQFLFGDGLGNFELGPYVAADGVPYNLLAVDLDQDNLDDIIASDYPAAKVHIFWSEGSLGSYLQDSFDANTKTIGVSYGDFNNDSKPDLIAINQGSATASLYLNLGQRVFEPQIEIDTYELPYSIAIANLDFDNNLDLVIAHSSEPSVIALFRGNGDGTFEEEIPLETDGRLIYVTTDDFNQDGKVDLIATRDRGGQASLFLGEDSFQFQSELNIPSGDSIYSVDLTRLNDDEYPDLIDIDFKTNVLTVSQGQDPKEYLGE